MKILIINMCMRPNSIIKMFPVGLGYIATSIKRAGYDFDLLDIDAYRFSDEEVATFISHKKYDVVCMGTIVTAYNKVKKMCSLIREKHPEAIIIVGNTVASSIPDILLNQTEADIAVLGEGDITIVEILDTIKKNESFECIQGIAYLVGDRVQKTPKRKVIRDINSLPFIDRSIFDIEIYIKNVQEQAHTALPAERSTLRGMHINTARGCIANCTFCYHVFKNEPYRTRNSENIIEEIRELIQQYDVNYFDFADELTFFNKKQAYDFAKKLVDSGLKFYWTGNCRAGIFDRDEDMEIIRIMKQAGCYGISFSLENASPEILKSMNKNITVDMFSTQASLIRRAGLPVWTSLVFGYPQETPESIAATFDVCIENKIYPSIGYLLPQPGSVMYDYARESGLIPDEEAYLLKMGDRQDLRLNMTSMTDEEFEENIHKEALRCKNALGLDMSDSSLIKTKNYQTPAVSS